MTFICVLPQHNAKCLYQICIVTLDEFKFKTRHHFSIDCWDSLSKKQIFILVDKPYTIHNEI